jgi:hypothetical protein
MCGLRLSYIFAKIGVVLSVFSIPALLILDLLLYYIWPWWFFLGATSYLTMSITMNVFFIVITITGLTLYIVGRRSFWEEADWDEKTLILGIILFLFGGFVSLWSQEGFKDMVGLPLFLSEPLNPGEPLRSFLPIVWSALLVITGVLWIVDFARLPRGGVIGAMVATTSFLVFSHLSWFGQKELGLGAFAERTLGFPAFSFILTTTAMLAFLGTVAVIAYTLKKLWKEW